MYEEEHIELRSDSRPKERVEDFQISFLTSKLEVQSNVSYFYILSQFLKIIKKLIVVWI